MRFESRFLIALLTALALIPTRGTAQPRLKLSASIPVETTPYTAVAIDVALENLGDDDVIFSDLIDPELFRVEVHFGKPEAVIYAGLPRVPRILKSHVLPNPLPRLNAGHKSQFKVIVDCKWDSQNLLDPLFQEPGDYEIRIRYIVVTVEAKGEHYTELKSDFVTLRVLAPKDEDAAALASIKSFSHPSWLLEPQEAVFSSKARNEGNTWEGELTRFLQNHPKSHWVPYAHNALGILYRSRAFYEKDNKLTERANLHLKIAGEAKGFPLKPSP